MLPRTQNEETTNTVNSKFEYEYTSSLYVSCFCLNSIMDKITEYWKLDYVLTTLQKICNLLTCLKKNMIENHQGDMKYYVALKFYVSEKAED